MDRDQRVDDEPRVSIIEHRAQKFLRLVGGLFSAGLVLWLRGNLSKSLGQARSYVPVEQNNPLHILPSCFAGSVRSQFRGWGDTRHRKTGRQNVQRIIL